MASIKHKIFWFLFAVLALGLALVPAVLAQTAPKPGTFEGLPEIQKIGKLLNSLDIKIYEYGNAKVDTDEVKDKLRNTARSALVSVRTRIMFLLGEENPDALVFSAAKRFNQMLANAAQAKCLSYDWLNEEFPLLDGTEPFDYLIPIVADSISAGTTSQLMAAYDNLLASGVYPKGQNGVKFPEAKKRVKNVYQAQLFVEALKRGISYESIKDWEQLDSPIQLKSILILSERPQCHLDKMSVTKMPYVDIALKIRTERHFEAFSTLACVDMTEAANRELLLKALEVENDYQHLAIVEVIERKEMFQRNAFTSAHTMNYANAIDCALKVWSNEGLTLFLKIAGWDKVDGVQAKDTEACIQEMEEAKKEEDEKKEEAREWIKNAPTNVLEWIKALFGFAPPAEEKSEESVDPDQVPLEVVPSQKIEEEESGTWDRLMDMFSGILGMKKVGPPIPPPGQEPKSEIKPEIKKD